MRFFRVLAFTIGCIALALVIAVMFGIQTTQTDRYFRVVVDTNVTDLQDRLAAETPDEFWADFAATVGVEDTQDFRREREDLFRGLSCVEDGSIVLIEYDRNNDAKTACQFVYRLPPDAIPSLGDQWFYIVEDNIFSDVILRTTCREIRLFGRLLSETIAWEDATIAYEWNTYDPSFIPYSTQEPFEYFFRVDQDELLERISSRCPIEFRLEEAGAISFYTDDETQIPKTFEFDAELFDNNLNAKFFSSEENVFTVLSPEEINGISVRTDGHFLEIRVDPDTAALPEIKTYRVQVELSEPRLVHDPFEKYICDVLSLKAID